MPLFATPDEKKKFIISKGVDPNRYDLDESPDQYGDLSWKPVITETPSVDSSVPSNYQPPPSTSKTEALLRSAANAVVPTATGLAGGAMLGSRLGRVGGTWGSLGGGLIGAVGGGMGGSALQNLVTTDNWKNELALAQQEHPYMSLLGGALPSLPAFNPIESIKQIPQMVKGLGGLLKTGRTAVNDRTMNLLANTAVNTGVGAGVNTAEQLGREDDKPFDVKELALATGINALLNEPTKLGKKIFGFQGTTDIPESNVAKDFPKNLRRNKPLISTEDYADPLKPDPTLTPKGGKPLESTYPKVDESGSVSSSAGKAAEYNIESFASKSQADLDAQVQRKAELDRLEADRLSAENAQREERLKSTGSAKPLESGSPSRVYQEESAIPPKILPTTPEVLRLENRPDLKESNKKLAAKRGMLYREEPEVEGNNLGYYQESTREAVMSKKRAALDTGGHEIGGHGHLRDLLRSPVLKDRQLGNRLLAIAGGEEEFAKLTGPKVYRRQDTALRGTAKDKFALWLKDFKNHFKTKFKLANDEDVLDFFAQRVTEDAPYGSRREFLPKSALEGVPPLTPTPVPQEFQDKQKPVGPKLVMPGEPKNENYKLRKDFDVVNQPETALKDPEEISNMTGADFRKAYPDGSRFTDDAYKYAESVKDQPDKIHKLKEYREKAKEEFYTQMRKAGQTRTDEDMQEMSNIGMKAQYFREAVERAENTGSAKREDDVKYQEETALDERDFLTSTEKELSKPRPFGLTLGNDKSLPIDTVRGKLTKNIPADELEALRASGLDEFLGTKTRVSIPELNNWIKENGPQLEVKKLHAKEVGHPEQQEIAELQHYFDTMGYFPHEIEGSSDYDYFSPQGFRAPSHFKASEEMAQKAKRFIELKDKRLAYKAEQEVDKDSATARFTSVNPKPLKDMPGAVDILVRVPTKKVKVGEETVEGRIDEDDIGLATSSVKFRGHHFGESDKNIVGWTRGYMETTPEGEKVFHVFELQSDWAQSRNRQREITDQLESADGDAQLSRMDDPSLNYYEHLALKAAIKHAKEQGADYIAISDGKTAMLTEQHDRHAQYKLVKEFDGTTFEGRQEAARWMKASESTRRNEPLLDEKGNVYKVRGLEKEVSQAKGMRLHYDETIPNIAKKLLGSEGTRVSFGEHQNAVVEGHGQWNETEGRTMPFGSNPRKDLIFKNPDGTPKTDITARMFPLKNIAKRVENKEPFSMFSKNYQSESALTENDIFPNKRHGFFKGFESAIDKVRRLGPQGVKVADKLERFFARKDQYQAMFRGVPYHDLTTMMRSEGLKDKDLGPVLDYVRGKYRGEEIPELNAGQQKVVDEIIQPLFKNIRELQNKEGLMVEDNYGKFRKGKVSEFYAPDMLSDEAIDLMVRRSTTPEAKYAMNEWARYVEEESGGKVGYNEARQNISEYVAALGGNKLFSIEFGALRKAAGYGLPPTLREKSLLKLVNKYGRRASQDLAYWKELQSDPFVSASLKLPKREGGHGGDPEVDTLIQTPEVQNALKFVFNDWAAVNNPKVTSAARMVTNALLGAPTGVRDLSAIGANAAPYLQNLKDVGAFFKAIGNYRDHKRKSLETGARSGTMDLDRWYTLDNPDTLTTTFNRAAEAFRKYQGRDLLENVNRIMSFGWGKEIAKGKLLDAINGDAKAGEWLNKFGTLIDQKDFSKWGEAELDQVGKNFTDRTQGTYDARGLPAGAMEGPFAPFVALSRWSVEKSNVIWKDVVEPARKGNFTPLLTYSLGSILTGAAIKELNELMSGKKASEASLGEAISEDNKLHAAAAVMSLMQLGGFAGIMSDLGKMVTDSAISGEKPRGLAFPLADFMTDTIGEGVRDYFAAVNSGSNPFEAAVDFSFHVLKSSVQNIRIANSRFLDSENTERSNKFRDMRVFQKLEGEEVPSLASLGSGNRFGNKDLREFKRTSDLGQAAQQLPELLQKAVERADGDPYKLKAELRRIKQNNYQTLPNPESLPISFVRMLNFITKNQGAEAASARLQDYMLQNAKNKVKSSLVP